MSSVNTWI